MGLLSLGSQLKAISDQLYAMADAAYAEAGIPLQGRWFPVLRLLHDQGPMTVGEIALAVGQTHSAISQQANRLVRDGWVSAASDPGDRRTRRLTLTGKAEAVLREAKPLWHAMQEVLEERVRAAGLDGQRTLDGLAQVARPGMAEEVAQAAQRLRSAAVRIVPFRPELREHFYRVNAGWLERFAMLEPYDLEVISNPERMIIEPGGAVLFAMLGDEVVGTCGLKLEGPDTFELTKMGVDPRAQGLGIGRKLIEAAIAEFQRIGGKVLFLESNSALKSAIRLYETSGFEHRAPKGESHYERADVYMVWNGPAGRP
jgi:DNA-binding MarR family transcriptional regulator/ribosomal protein S18 acetylase RimI-like enzyme